MSVYQFEVNNIAGENISLENYSGKVLLIVNTASKCGLTPQYKGLEKLYTQYKDKGLEVLGFPCNQFLQQEPGDEAEISEFCQLKYGVDFPLFSKLDVNGSNTHPLYDYLKKKAPGILGSEGIKWNFTKFLIDSNGKVYKRYAPKTQPAEISKDIEKLLAAICN